MPPPRSPAIVLIPTYNERENLEPLIPRVLQAAPQADVLLIDDESPDGTADHARHLFGREPRFAVLRRAAPRGLGRSYVDGYLHALAAGYARIAQMDADLSHDPDCLPALLDAALDADVALGSRYCPGGAVRDWPIRRILLSRFANAYVRAVAGVPARDSTSGFRCYTREALLRIGVDQIVSNGYAFQVEMTFRAHRAGLRIAEVPITFTDRTRGRSKISRSVLIESMILPWRLRLGLAGGSRQAVESQG